MCIWTDGSEEHQHVCLLCYNLIINDLFFHELTLGVVLLLICSFGTLCPAVETQASSHSSSKLNHFIETWYKPRHFNRELYNVEKRM